MAGATMLAAGLSIRGARADRDVGGIGRAVAVPQVVTAAQRMQSGPRFTQPRPAAQKASDLADFAGPARPAGGPRNVGNRRADDGRRPEQMADLAASPRRKMRALSVETSEISVDRPTERDRAARGETGAAGGAPRGVAEKEGAGVNTALKAGRSVVLFDRLVININLAGGS
jgi:hypothetical protein